MTDFQKWISRHEGWAHKQAERKSYDGFLILEIKINAAVNFIMCKTRVEEYNWVLEGEQSLLHLTGMPNTGDWSVLGRSNSKFSDTWAIVLNLVGHQKVYMSCCALEKLATP